MSNGISIDLSELIALKRFAEKPPYPPVSNRSPYGAHKSKLRGRGMDFAEVRHYQPGDEIRHMEWRITAKTGKPHVKIYEEERERTLLILIDFCPSMFFGTRGAFKSVIASQLMALLSWGAIHQGDRVGGLIFSSDKHHEFMPRRRDKGILPFLSKVSEYSQINPNQFNVDKKEMLNQALQKLHRIARPGNVIALISDWYGSNEYTFEKLTQLKSHNDVLVYRVCDAIELHAPLAGLYPITNGEHQFLLDMTDQNVKNEYENYCLQKNQMIKNQLSHFQIPFFEVTFQTDLPRLAYQIVSRRAR